MNTAVVVVDANIAFKLLCAGRSDLRIGLAPDAPLKFCSPRFTFADAGGRISASR